MNHPQEYFDYKNRKLFCEKIPIESVISKWSTPLYIYSHQAISDRVIKLQKALKPLNSLICFAVKANNNLSILNLLKQLGLGFDLVSGGELFKMQKIGMSGSQLVFSGVGKTKDEIMKALTYENGKGIKGIQVESYQELKLIDQVASELKTKASVVFRFNPDIDAKTHPYISTGLKENKFGNSKTDLLLMVGDLEKFKSVELKGLSIHIGSQILELNPFEAAFKELSDLASEVVQKINRPIEIINLGGGLGVQYDNEKPISFEDYTKLIKKYFSKKPWIDDHKTQILLEPGRSLLANAGVLISKVLYLKKGENKNFMIVDAAMNDLLRPGLYGSYHRIIPLYDSPGKKDQFDIVGPICESSDFFAKDRLLSSKIKQNDCLAILSTGAYGFSMSGQFNSRPKVAEVMIKGDDSFLIRQRENLDDLIRNEKMYDFSL